MPNNRVIYWGVVVLVATVLLWIGAELTKRVEWLLPYTGAAAIAAIVGGFIHEWWKARSPRPHEVNPLPPPKDKPGPDITEK